MNSFWIKWIIFAVFAVQMSDSVLKKNYNVYDLVHFGVITFTKRFVYISIVNYLLFRRHNTPPPLAGGKICFMLKKKTSLYYKYKLVLNPSFSSVSSYFYLTVLTPKYDNSTSLLLT